MQPSICLNNTQKHGFIHTIVDLFRDGEHDVTLTLALYIQLIQNVSLY